MYKLKKLQLKDKKKIKEFVSKFEPYSDFNFTSFWSYNTQSDAYFFLNKEMFVIKLRDYITNKHFYSLLTEKEPLRFVKSFISMSKKEKLAGCLRLVPAVVIDKLSRKNNSISISEDRDSFDYVLSTKKVSELAGPNFSHHRWRVGQFKRYYPSHEIRVTNCTSPSEKKEILRLSKLWAKNKKKDANHEIVAISRLLKDARFLNLINISVWIQNRLVGFAIVERHDKTWAVGHFMKADTKYKGIFDILYHETSKHLHNIGCELLNYEQDLGDENLRKAKLYWNPEKFLKKYTLTLEVPKIT